MTVPTAPPPAKTDGPPDNWRSVLPVIGVVALVFVVCSVCGMCFGGRH
ncbi:hypothetical protein Afil01_26940 [Actinorhabdospora filicis]|uniref:Uncharacterized protein n=1 Tax=Actinorhabdospora filicis TaxID=1785913 RepID=A0A9W6W390_9ACTN|nr:hypothetical protein [Actinorhabdospora filicis]GLZ77887.1 hypothetical protein Afil01_26940 [Actinorhabdospora filicis]